MKPRIVLEALLEFRVVILIGAVLGFFITYSAERSARHPESTPVCRCIVKAP